MDRAELEFAQYVLEELSFLEDSSQPSATESQLRRTSVVLRELINGQNLIKCWKLFGYEQKQPTIVAPRLNTDALSPGALSFAGGAQRGAITITGFTFETSVDVTKLKPRAAGPPSSSHEFRLSEYPQSAAAVIDGIRVSRHQLIAFVANKKGGAHFDSSRKKDEAAYKLLDKVENLHFGGAADVSFLPAVYFELLSIGQHLTTSPDIIRLVDELRSL